MTKSRVVALFTAAFWSLAFVSIPSRAQKPATDVKLPEVVKKTFDAAFPKAEIQKIDVEEEGGVTVYDVEFKQGSVEKETDIAADGTMLEVTVVIDAKSVPAAALKPIQAAAVGATMTRVEEIKISHETKDGKVVKLPSTLTRYAVELKKGDQTAEIVVDPDGKVLEEPKFAAPK
jgi:uncharacterized membrane protein YkoI